MFEAFLHDPIANTIAVIILLLMTASVIAVTWFFLQGKTNNRLLKWPDWVIPVLSIFGLGVASYLSYVEITDVTAICGPIGNCNDVQRSPFATLFGILPVGILGAIGYIGILSAFLVQKFAPSSLLQRQLFQQPLHKLITLALWGMAWFGIIFTIYLTYLEPFVIGATCIWCISSAIIMTIIYWASTGPAIETMQMAEIEGEDI